jgi:hypothetical protein
MSLIFPNILSLASVSYRRRAPLFYAYLHSLDLKGRFACKEFSKSVVLYGLFS